MRHGFAVRLLFLALVAFVQHAVFAQQGIDSESRGGFPMQRTAHFDIRIDPLDVSQQEAQALGLQMEGRLAVYNQIFRFDTGRLAMPLRVRAFRSRELYESHVGSRLSGEVPPGAVYLHFAQAELRELVIHLGNEGDALPFQAFIQFLRAFVPNPPAWIRDGFAVHFATLGFDEGGEPTHRENLVWLDAIRGMRELPSPASIMRTAAPASVENFPGLAWSLVSFFLNSGNENYLRSLTESFVMLSYANTAEENAIAVANRIEMWNDMDEMAIDHLNYLNSLRSFSEVIAEGQAAYGASRTAEAEAAFRRALEIRPDHYVPWYYLGLLAYNTGDTETAERYYRIALYLGGDTASMLYALALNAATAGRTDEAVELLLEIAAIAPDRFGERARTLIAQLENIRGRQ